MVYELSPETRNHLDRIRFEQYGCRVLSRLFPDDEQWRQYGIRCGREVHGFLSDLSRKYRQSMYDLRLDPTTGRYTFDKDPELTIYQPPLDFHEWYRKTFEKSCLEFSFIVTNSCNLRCSYCYQTTKTDCRMSLETAKRTVDLLFESDEAHGQLVNEESAHALVLSFIGGEPLLEIDLIDQIMQYFLESARARNHRWMTQYMISMTSNGTLFYNSDVQAFIRKYHGRLSICITIDGDEALHDSCRVFPDGTGSYALARDAFVALTRNDPVKGTKLTIAPGNVALLSGAVIHMIDEFDLRVLHANCVFEEGWTVDHARTLFRELVVIADWLIAYAHPVDFTMFSETIGQPLSDADTQNWCGGTGKMRAVNTDGTLLPCVRYAKESLHGPCEYAIGHVDDGFLAASEHKERWMLLNSVTRQSQSPSVCIGCPIASGCAWCSAYNYDVYGTPNRRATFICVMHKARVLANAYYQIKRRMHDNNTIPRYPLNIPREWALEIIDEDEYERLLTSSVE